MSLNRIQKLLFSEYCDFEDMVLVESPFAQTTRDGLGLRQVQLGLTPTKLVLAVDVLPSALESKPFCDGSIDPEIETLELIAVYPVECVNLSVFRRRKRQSLKAHFCNNRIVYFELGGFEMKKMFWNLWCERVKFLCPEDGGSSVSETSVATSTSTSTLNIISANHNVTKSGKPQFWCKFSKENKENSKCKWVEKYLYVDETKNNDNVIKSKINLEVQNECHNDEQSIEKSNFVQEGCGEGLFLPAENYILPNKDISETSTESTDVFTLYPVVSSHFSQMSENAVQNWETNRKISGSRGRHPRRYGLAPQSHFLYGLGPWNVHIGDRVSIQMKRSASAVRIRRQPDDIELNLSISKRLLSVSVSCEAFHIAKGLNIDCCVSKLAAPDKNALLFWTPEYWYRPQPAKESYKEFLEHLHNLKRNLERNYDKGNKKKKGFKKKKPKIGYENGCGDSIKNFSKLFAKDQNLDTYLHRLRTALKIEVALTAWDFDSTTLAYQLTMIDKELFKKIRPYELHVIVWQKSAKNTPNINSLIAFSHRVSCLVATEILRDNSDKIRSRLIVRFINAADKCDRISNYQSCKSLLSGLQSVSIYRLYNTWAYLRLHHAMKYQLFENLCRRYSDPRLLTYQKSFYLSSVSPPYLPYIGDIFSRLFDKVATIPNNFITQITLDTNKLASHFDEEKENITSEIGNIYLHYMCDNRRHFSLQNNFSSSTVPYKILKFFTSLKLWPNVELAENKTKKSTKNVKIENTDKKIIKNDRNFEQNRTKRLDEVLEFLENCQKAASKYALSRNDLAQEYLLKARYREDRENFYNFKL